MVDYIKDLNIELAGSVQGTLPGMVAEVVKIFQLILIEKLRRNQVICLL